jgi:hypothetical protein
VQYRQARKAKKKVLRPQQTPRKNELEIGTAVIANFIWLID